MTVSNVGQTPRLLAEGRLVSIFLARRCQDRRIYPGRRRRRLGFGTGPNEAFGVEGIRPLQDLLPSLDDFLRAPIVEHFWRQ